jgi:hypothetical protein
LDNLGEAANKYHDGAHMLDNNGGISDEWPKIVGPEAGVSLEVIKKSLCVGIVVRICVLSAEPQHM